MPEGKAAKNMSPAQRKTHVLMCPPPYTCHMLTWHRGLLDGIDLVTYTARHTRSVAAQPKAGRGEEGGSNKNRAAAHRRWRTIVPSTERWTRPE